MTKGYEFYGAEVSYFSGKVRAYLRYKRIPFSEITPSREIYRTIIMARVGWPVIPVVVTPEDETWQDSSEIIDNFEARFPEGDIYPEGAKQKLAALLIEAYADEWLKIPAMHYRWTKNRDWAISEFGRLSRPDFRCGSTSFSRRRRSLRKRRPRLLPLGENSMPSTVRWTKPGR